MYLYLFANQYLAVYVKLILVINIAIKKLETISGLYVYGRVSSFNIIKSVIHKPNKHQIHTFQFLAILKYYNLFQSLKPLNFTVQVVFCWFRF